MEFSFNLNRTANASVRRLLPYGWDFVAFPLIICLSAMASVGFHQTLAPMSTLKTQVISLDPAMLPEYAMRTTLRMLAAMVASLLFTLTYGTLAAKSRRAEKVLIPIPDILQSVGVFVLHLTVYVVYHVLSYVATGVTLDEVGHVFELGLITLIRVALLIAISPVIWVPLGVLIGLRPALAEKIQPLAQFLAAFPANPLFPVIVIVKYHLTPDIWLAPLIVLGTQWYILFNVIACATARPNDYREAATNFRIRGWQWWRRVMLPGSFPYYVTGAGISRKSFSALP